jgi:hypothetical protein
METIFEGHVPLDCMISERMKPTTQDRLLADWNAFRRVVAQLDANDLRFLAVVPITVLVWLFFWYLFFRADE